jgi:EAL domain-containing protein (putative c-di-GMP-specific phosphodiesterase class I)
MSDPVIVRYCRVPVTDTLKRHRAAAGEVIFREGEAAECAYVIESGAVTITAAREGAEIELARLRAGEPLGEMALLDDRVRSATASALEPTTLIVVGRDQVMRKLAGADPLIRMFLRVVLRRLRRTSGLVGRSAPGGGRLDLEQEVDDTGLHRLRREAIEMLDRETEIERGLERGQFEMFFQPMVRLENGHAAGFEALLRWRQPDGGVREPATFVPLAEQAGLAARLTRVVLPAVCGAVAPLQRAVAGGVPAMPPAFVSLNLSAGELAEAALVDTIVAALDAAGVDPRYLQVEVTESVLMEDPEQSARVLLDFKGHGVTVGVDDFGTGYSSLAYLQHLPLDVLKIDRSFVARLPESAGSRKIVRAVARLAADMGLITVAEGVERPEELTFLRDYGCDLAQGFLFAPPLPLAEAVSAAGRRLAERRVGERRVAERRLLDPIEPK